MISRKNLLIFGFYTNLNKIANDIKGLSGPSRAERTKLAAIKEEIALLEAKIKAKKIHNVKELENLKLKERILELQVLKVFISICRNYRKKFEN